ncbi:tetratricopeptide repeat protein 37-like [Vanessa cardui]|uniref:tetratricopeptide repeat protein 37-like n=1 Tax=Vanessa cardui TaxID=171605 RepID=UPI001F12A231|nr:tetratricopeptide repeat protein 37-like [Vanessa cardui]
MADIKPILKRAKKLMDDKKYFEAEICCKKILQINRQNYLALVYLGKIRGDSEEALEYLQKAISYQPKKPLAWQGLANYYERKKGIQSKFALLNIYDEILKLEIDKEKAEDVLSKVAEIGFALKDSTSIGILIDYLSTKPERYLYNFTEFQLLELLNINVAHDGEQLSVITNKILQKVMKDPTNNSICILLGKVMLLNRNFIQAFEQLTKLPFFASNVVFRMWLCQYMCTVFAQYESFWGIDIEKYYDDIVQGNSNSKFPRLLNSMILYNKKKYVDAYIVCNQLVEYEEAGITESIFIIKCTFKTRNWAISEALAKKFLSYSTDFNITLELNKFLFLALAQQKKWPQAIIAARDVPHDALLVKEQAMLATCYIQNKENNEHLMNILQPTPYFVQLKALALLMDGKYVESIDMLQNEPENPVNLFYIGKAYWLLKQYEVSYSYFMEAVVLDQNYADAYYYMGKYYEKFKLELAMAKTHYEIAHKLDYTNPKILKSLSNINLSLNLKEDNYHLLRNVNHLVIILPWLHFRLAIYFKERDDLKSSIRQFEYVVKYDNSDIQALEYLAEAYQLDERLDLSIDCYNKIIRLDHTRQSHCLSRIASMQISAKRYHDAHKTFEKMLELRPKCSMVLKGATDFYMKLAKMYTDGNQYHIARHAAQKSVTYLITAISVNKKVFLYWNMLASAILLIATLPGNHCYININFNCNEELGNLGSIFNKMNMFKLGYYCLWRGQSLLPPHLEKYICQELASEIYDDEVSAKLARYANAGFVIEYQQGVGYIVSSKNNRIQV